MTIIFLLWCLFMSKRPQFNAKKAIFVIMPQIAKYFARIRVNTAFRDNIPVVQLYIFILIRFFNINFTHSSLENGNQYWLFSHFRLCQHPSIFSSNIIFYRLRLICLSNLVENGGTVFSQKNFKTNIFVMNVLRHVSIMSKIALLCSQGFR